MWSSPANGLQQLLDLLYPPKCISCQRSGQGSLCPTCRAAITFIRPPICQKCGYPNRQSVPHCWQCQHHDLCYLDAIRAVALYDDNPLQTAIRKFKYQNNRTAVQVLASFLVDCYHSHHLKTDLIVPVPLHPKRQKERGYNQSLMLAERLSMALRQPMDTKSLVRQRVTQSQMSLKGAERKANVADAFQCQSDKLRDKTILLIDDVCTTGATLNACAQALKNSGVAAVFGLTLARA